MLGPRVLEHPVLADPLLTQLPDLVLGLLPAEEDAGHWCQGRGRCLKRRSIGRFVIPEKAPARAFS